MTSFRLRTFACTCVLLLFVPEMLAQNSSSPSKASVSGIPARVTQTVDDTRTTRIQNSKHPLAITANDRGRVDGSFAMNRVLLMLKPSEAQHASLKTLLDSQHDPSSPNFQKWLAPEDFALRFGPNSTDLAKVTSWLQQHGLQVKQVAKGGQWIEFSGSAEQIENTFRTEIHHYLVSGEKHIANSQDISIPQALAPVIRGLASLHDFRPHPLHGRLQQVRRDSNTGQLKPLSAPVTKVADLGKANPNFTYNTPDGQFHLLTPADWSRIYNTAPLLKDNVNGSGISIAVVGSDSGVQLSDIRTFRSIFGLPANDPEFIVDGPDPGIFFSDAELEADLDIEWAGAIAPNAKIKFVTSASTASTPGFFNSIAYIVDHRIAPIMSISIGGCELFFGPDGNAFMSTMYQQAAAEGISVISAAGDTGNAGCDPQFANGPAFFGSMVNASASTQFNVSIGGTQFAENGQDSTYWKGTNAADSSSVIGYIPEAVWNSSCDPTTDPNYCFGNGFSLQAGSGGASNCVQSTLMAGDEHPTWSCFGGYPKPSWQAGVGVPDDHARDLPDISLSGAGDHDGYLMCFEGSCQTAIVNGKTVLSQATVVGGTSAGAPAFSGIMALLEQKLGAYVGLPNYMLYRLAATNNLVCNSSSQTDPTLPNSCVFYDVTAGNNNVPGQAGADAVAGYDLATGLGTLNVANLVSSWGSADKLATLTALVTSGGTVQHGDPLPMQVTVHPATGMGAPSGDFSLLTDKFGAVSGGTLTDGGFTGGVRTLPGGTYNVQAHYAGDAMFKSSDSAALKVKVMPEGSVFAAQPWYVNLANSAIPLTNNDPVNYGQQVGIQFDIQGKSGIGLPSGSITVQLDGTQTFGPYALNGAGNTFVWFDHTGTTGLLPGVHKFTAQYSGDNSFRSTTSSPVNITVQKTNNLTSVVSNLQDTPTAGTPIDLIFALGDETQPLGVKLPTGTMQLFECRNEDIPCKGWYAISSPLPIASDGLLGPGIPQAFLKMTFKKGVHLLVASYSGDVNYEPVPIDSTVFARTFPMEVAPAPKADLVFTQNMDTVALGQSVTYTVTVKPPHKSDPVPTGSIYMTDVNALFFTQADLVNGSAIITVPWYHAQKAWLFASYSGDDNYARESSNSIVTTIKQGTLPITLSAGKGPNGTTTLTASMPAPTDSNLTPPGYLGAPVEYLDSVNGGPAQVLGSGAIPLTLGIGTASINMLQVSLPKGTNNIVVHFLGNGDWAPATSSPITVTK
jgi:hypothetical protein